jgi:hypothetical protein
MYIFLIIIHFVVESSVTFKRIRKSKLIRVVSVSAKTERDSIITCEADDAYCAGKGNDKFKLWAERHMPEKLSEKRRKIC